jgi:hypothetical protein
MTRAHHLLAELATLGVTLSAEGTRLRLSPRSALTEGVIARVLAAKAELLALLRTAPAPTTVPALPHIQWWVLCAVAHSPHLPRTVLYTCVPAPPRVVDHALAALLNRGELRARSDGAVDLNVC